MPGFSSITGQESVMFADNCSFDGTKRGGVITTDGQFWIGNSASPRVRVGTITSPLGTITIGYSAPNITIDLAGGGVGIDSINVDASTPPGTDPVLPDGAGQITITGAQVAAGVIGANVIRTDSLAANTFTIEIQRTTTSATPDSSDNGVSHFNSAHFTVDANGFVSSTGAGFPWIDQGSSITLSINTGYFVTAATTQTLPAAPSQGDVIKIICDTTGAVVVTANAGQTIRLGSSVTAVAGTFTSTARGDALELIYRAATTQWLALNSVGNWTVT